MFIKKMFAKNTNHSFIRVVSREQTRRKNGFSGRLVFKKIVPKRKTSLIH